MACLIAGPLVAEGKRHGTPSYVGTYTGGRWCKGHLPIQMDLTPASSESLGVAAGRRIRRFSRFILQSRTFTPSMRLATTRRRARAPSPPSDRQRRRQTDPQPRVDRRRLTVPPRHRQGQQRRPRRQLQRRLHRLSAHQGRRLARAGVTLINTRAPASPGNQQGRTPTRSLDAANKFAVAADLGSITSTSTAGRQGLLTANDPIGGNSSRLRPRHFAFHLDGKHAFVINEISRTMTSFATTPTRASSPNRNPLGAPGDAPAGSTAGSSSPERQMGLRLNRSHRSIAVFSWDAAKEQMKRVSLRRHGADARASSSPRTASSCSSPPGRALDTASG